MRKVAAHEWPIKEELTKERFIAAVQKWGKAHKYEIHEDAEDSRARLYPSNNEMLIIEVDDRHEKEVQTTCRFARDTENGTYFTEISFFPKLDDQNGFLLCEVYWGATKINGFAEGYTNKIPELYKKLADQYAIKGHFGLTTYLALPPTFSVQKAKALREAMRGVCEVNLPQKSDKPVKNTSVHALKLCVGAGYKRNVIYNDLMPIPRFAAMVESMISDTFIDLSQDVDTFTLTDKVATRFCYQIMLDGLNELNNKARKNNEEADRKVADCATAIEELKKKTEQLQKAVDAEKLAAEERLLELEQRDAEKIQELTEELAMKEQEIFKLRQKCDTFKHQLQRKNTTAADQFSITLPSVETDYYDGEIKAILIHFLKKKVKEMADDPNLVERRLYHVLAGLVNANEDASAPLREQKAELQSIFSGSLNWLGHAMMQQLSEMGFAEIPDTKTHTKICWHDDSRYTFTLPNTPTDPRASINTETTIQRGIF